MTLDATGLLVKRADDVRADLVIAIKAALGPGASTQPDGPLGLLIGIQSVAIGLVWEALQQVYDALDPDTATGEALDNVAALVGVSRRAATRTTGTVTLTATGAGTVPVGSICRIPGGARFLTLTEVVFVGAGSQDVEVEAEETGVIEAPAASITEMVTIFAFISAVTNDADLTTGRARETDALLRLRREASLQIIGAGTEGAIASRLGEIEDVLTVRVKSNRTMTTDADGIPPKAFEVVLHPSTLDEATVASAIFDVMPAGIEPFGQPDPDGVETLVTDTQGFETIVKWSWAAPQVVHVEVTLAHTSAYPLDGDAQVAAAVAAYGDSLDVGDPVILLEILCAVMQAVPGIRTASVRAKIGGPPGGVDVVDLILTFRQIATIDAINVDVISTPL